MHAAVAAALFLAVGFRPLLSGRAPLPLLVGAGAAMLAVALFAPALPRPLNRAWGQFGLFLGKVINPIIMGFTYYGVVTPTGLLFRLLHKDPLRLAQNSEAETFWIERRPPGPCTRHNGKAILIV